VIMGFRFPVFWVRGFFFGFLGEVGQSALCFLVGRSSKFLQLSAGIQSCRGNLFNLIVIIIAYLPFDFLMVLNYYYHSVTIVNTVFCATKNSWFFLCCFWSSVSGIRSVLINWVCWVRGNFSGGPGHVYIPCLYLFSVRLAGRYNFIWSQWWGGRRDCTDFPSFLALYRWVLYG
jgi:hypothetical protein